MSCVEDSASDNSTVLNGYRMIINPDSLHSRLLALLKQFHSVCQNNHIPYYMLGGTCLGAIRHGGFIPWDDDVDVGIPREHYERFIRLSQSELGDGYEVRFYANNNESPFHYAKYIDSNTTLVEQHYTDYVEGLYIDVFPLESLSTNRIARSLLFYRAHLFQSLILNHCTTDTGGRPSKNVYRSIARHVSLEYLHSQLETVMTSQNNSTGEYIGNLLGAWGQREIMKSEVFGEPTLYGFEDASFYGPQHAECYLEALYGDWQTPPPMEERSFRHEYHYINLDLPYNEYQSLGE